MNNIIKEIKFSLIDLIVLVFYYIFTCFLFLGLSGLFNRFSVFCVLFILLLALFFLRNSISFPKKYLWFFLVVPVAAAGFGFLRGFFTGDAYSVWLPAARDLVQNGKFPEVEVSYYFSRMPLFSSLLAGTFVIFKSFNEFLGIWIPFFFTSASLMLIYHWAKERGLNKKLLAFIPFLFLTNIIVEFFGSWNLLQESLILFFGTAFFYYYDRFLSENRKKDLIFLILSLVLACASKISGFFLLIFIPWLFIRTKNKRELIQYSFLFFVPIILWLIRNYFIFDNPVFPSFNSIFKGKYYDGIKQHNLHHALPDEVSGFLNQSFWVLKNYFWMAYPFILLSFYGFFKKRRYDYIVLILSFFVVKEAFLFTINISSARYYYLFLGLFLVYAFLGLKELKSRVFITILVSSAILGLFLVPIIDSESGFISLFENKFHFLFQIFVYLQNYWYLTLIVLIPLVYLVSKRENIKIFLILFYSLFLLHLRFIANKSWINTWPFIFLALILLLVFVFAKRIKYLKQIIMVIIILMVFANSWLMASAYYWNQGEIILPVPFVWENSRSVENALNKLTSPEERDTFYIVVATQKEYFSWWTDYQTMRLFHHTFFFILEDYDKNMSPSELKQLLEDHHVKYIVQNTFSYDVFGSEYVKFFEKINNSNLFNLVAKDEGKYCIWQVY